MKFNAAFFTSLFHFSRSTTHTNSIINPTKMLRYLPELLGDTQWPRTFSRLTTVNAQGLKVVLEQVLFIALLLGLLTLLVFNGVLWFNPELRDAIIVQHYTEQPQTYSSPGYNQSSGQAPSVSFSQRLYTP
ncbi:MAG: hypothetical protein AB4042_15750 [Leptolyngbyaceae cyanobacterium]